MATRLVMGVALICVGLVLGVCSAGLYVFSLQRERAGVPMAERETADMDACRVAELAIAGHRAPAATAFDGDCGRAIVTRVWTKPGFVIVTRTLKEPESAVPAASPRFSALLDGRGNDRWLLVDVKPASSDIALDTSTPR